MALPEFDPFWSRVVESGIFVGMHGSDSGYQRYQNEWEGVRSGEMLPFQDEFGVLDDPLPHAPADHGHDRLAHRARTCSRFPDLRIAPVESGSNWVRYLLGELAHAYEMAPHEFDEDPVAVFRRNVFIHPFHEEDPIGLVDILGADRVLFGSDYPHPEGMSDPISFVDQLQGLDESAIRKVMGGNLAGLMRVSEAA